MQQVLPDADSFTHPRKKGCLLKLVGKGWFSTGSWKKRFCVLDGTKFYYYENEKSCGSEKTSGVISLDYYDLCEPYDAKDKRNAHVFVIGTSVRGFFDNNHQFAAETSEDMQDWIRSVHDIVAEARNIRSRAGRNRVGSNKVSPVSGNRVVALSEMNDDFDENGLNIDGDKTPQLLNANKDRVKGPQGRRLPQRKSMLPTSSPSEEGVKQRSFSLSNHKEDLEETSDQSSSDHKRISQSMETVHQDNDAQDSDCQKLRSTSDNFSPTGIESSPTRKPVFGRLGGQHAALTKELEMKLKSGLAPGGRRFHPHKSESEEDITSKSRTGSESDELEKKIESITNTLNSVHSFMHDLEERFKTLKQSSEEETECLVKDLVSDTSATLKEIQEHSGKCREALGEIRLIRDEHRRLIAQCQESLQQKNAQHATPSSGNESS